MMTPERARTGTRVRVMDHHRVEQRRGLVGTVVAVYGGENYVAVDVRLADGVRRLFWPRDLEEVSPPKARWRFLLERVAGIDSGSYSPNDVVGVFCERRVDGVL